MPKKVYNSKLDELEKKFGMPIEIIATKPETISRAPIDGFSIGHILMGQIGYLVVYYIIRAFGNSIIPNESIAIIIMLCIGVGWELLENSIMYNRGLKYQNKQDSLINSTFDIIFVMTGTLEVFILQITFNYYILPELYFIILHIILISVEFLLFAIWYWSITPHK